MRSQTIKVFRAERGGNHLETALYLNLKQGEPLPEDYQGRRRLPSHFEAILTDGFAEETFANTRIRPEYEFEGLLVGALASFVNLPIDELPAEIGRSLARVCSFLGLDRAGFWRTDSGDSESLRLTQQWMAGPDCKGLGAPQFVGTGVRQSSLLLPVGTRSNACFPWITERVQLGKIVMFAKLDELPLGATQDREYLSRIGTTSSVIIPLIVQNKIMGAINFDMVSGERVWTQALLRRLELVAEIFADVTARARLEESAKEAEKLLRESEARFRIVADSAPVLIWMSGTDKLCNFFNKPWLDFTGRSLEQENGNGWAEGVHGEDVERCLQIYSSAFDGRHPFVMQYRLRRHDGEYRWICDNGVPRYEADGTFAGFIGSCIDITEQRAVEEALTKSLTEIRELKDRLQAEADYLKAESRLIQAHGEIIGQSQGIKKVLHQVEKVAPADCTVLITGETGTGKELIAQELHRLSSRKERLMVLVNCAALPSGLVESELFGRERGAYTGALTSQVGRFEVAHGSTIFLDEVGELPLEVQAKLLRVLQQGEFQRLGSPKLHKVNVRVIAATNRDLAAAVRKGRFREDLFYRLRVFPIAIPPLRERIEDLPLLAFAFLEEFSTRMGKKITKVPRKAMEALQRHSWPGNIRELRNVIEHSVILSSGDMLKLSFLGDSPVQDTQLLTLAEAEREHILRALESTGWRIKGPHGAAQRLDLQPSTLYSRMQKLGIPHRRQKDEMSTEG